MLFVEGAVFIPSNDRTMVLNAAKKIVGTGS